MVQARITKEAGEDFGSGISIIISAGEAPNFSSPTRSFSTGDFRGYQLIITLSESSGNWRCGLKKIRNVFVFFSSQQSNRSNCYLLRTLTGYSDT